MDLSQNQELFDASPIGILIVTHTQERRIIYANPFFIKIKSIADGDILLADFWPEISKINFDSGFANQVVAFEKHWLNLNFQSGKWKGQDCLLIWTVDVSAIKRAELSLQEAIEQADRSAQTKSNFLATMSHEMRTPMQSVFGLLELITHENPSPAISGMVDIAKNSASNMLEILDDILDLAKMDAEKMELDQFEVPVRTLARGVLEALAFKTKDKPITLIDDIKDDVPFVVLGDPKRLRQILINLTGNALKFTETGFVKIHITPETKCLPQHIKGLRFEIIDSGIGMNEATQKKLFNSFTQADSSTARKYGGTGLGLSISKKLVEFMNGEIGVISKEGDGSVFWFEIPMTEISQASANQEMPDLKGISILSVEDHPQAAAEIAHSLRSMGASVESCPTYTEALELTKRRPFDVGIIDQGLPDGLGIDLIREILELRPYMGLFMYTVRDDTGLLHSLQNLGVNYVAKPASRLGLGQKVLEACARSPGLKLEGLPRLLIAEDTASVRDILQRQLKRLGVEADFVSNGREALDALESGQYSILFTDLHMPDMDGYELAKILRARNSDKGRHMPIIVLTADIQMAQRQVYLEHGFDECLLKPVSLGHFKRLLIRWGLLSDTLSVPISGPEDDKSSIDMAALIDQMGAFDDSAKEMLEFFAEMTEPLMEKLSAAYETRNVKDVLNLTHSLKGSARSACALELGKIASDMLDLTESGNFDDKIMEDALAEFKRVKTSISALIRTA